MLPDIKDRPENERKAAAYLYAKKRLAEMGITKPRWVPHSPTERQKLFLDLKDKEAFFGGAAGGGKSDALLMAALQYVHVPNYSALILRRSFADLSLPNAIMSRAREWLSGTKAKWKDTEKTWVFPSGATLTFGYLESENDKYRYQSAEFQFVGFDEVSQFTESQYTYLFSRLRRLISVDVPLRMRSASNPGGVGARWVYARFIPEDFTPDQSRDIKVFEKFSRNEDGDIVRRVFIPAMLEDNPYLDRKGYEESLYELDPVTKAQLLRGDWTIQARGDILGMWNENVHVITWDEFAAVFNRRSIPLNWMLSVYQDWGTTSEHPCVTTWFATASLNAPRVNGVHLAGAVFVYRGFMTWDATVREVAKELIQRMAPDGERARITRWQMSHEAASERIAYKREHDLPFNSWSTGKTRGIAQLRNALELTELDKPHPFRPQHNGHPKLYFIVSPEEMVHPQTDDGLARWRAEIPAYRWNTLKSGDPVMSLTPYALFNDAIDTLRAAAADYWPDVRGLSETEQRELKLAPQLRMPAIAEETHPDILQAKLQSRDLYLKRMIAEQERAARATTVVPKIRFRR
jgi:hypothetical protein